MVYKTHVGEGYTLDPCKQQTNCVVGILICQFVNVTRTTNKTPYPNNIVVWVRGWVGGSELMFRSGVGLAEQHCFLGQGQQKL